MKKILSVFCGLAVMVAAVFSSFGESVAYAAESERKAFLLDACEDTASIVSGRADAMNYIEGVGCLIDSGIGPTFALSLTDFDVVAREIFEEDAYVEFYLFADKPEVLTGDSQLEFTQDGNYNDDKEMSWQLSAVLRTLQPGWNYVCLPFKKAAKVGGIDYNSINFMRMYFLTADGESCTMRLDSLRIVDKALDITADDIVPITKDSKAMPYIVDPNCVIYNSAAEITICVVGGVLIVAGAVTLVFVVRKRKKGVRE